MLQYIDTLLRHAVFHWHRLEDRLWDFEDRYPYVASLLRGMLFITLSLLLGWGIVALVRRSL